MNNMNIKRLTAIISVVRHGEKDESGALTAKGQQQAVIKGIKIPYLKGQVKLFHSGVDRVRKTVELIGGSINTTIEKIAQNPQGTLSFSPNPHPITQRNELHYAPINSNSTYFSAWQSKRMQDYLNLHKTSPESGTPSPQETAVRMATIVYEEIEAALSTSYEQRTNVVIATHEPVVMAFLFYACNSFIPDSKIDFVKAIGGSVGFAEGFDIRVYQDELGKESLCLLEFRDILVELSIKKLHSFIAS